MKKLKIIFITALCAFVAVPASADMVSFLYADSFAGVDGDTSGWSTDTTMVNLGVSSWSLLSGMASVDAYENGSLGTFTQRGIRGLGVSGGIADDEVDTLQLTERIEITFPTLDYYVNSLEVRSLFIETGGTEQGVVDFYLGGGSSFYTESLVAVQAGGNGVLAISYGTPMLVDKLVFYVPSGQAYTNNSEFAVAKLDVTPVPVPAAVLLGILGLSVAGVKLRKHA